MTKRQRKRRTGGSESKLTLWSDASVINNGKPGMQCSFAVVMDDDSERGALLHVEDIGEKTVNDGEYQGVIWALGYAKARGIAVKVITDSQLVAKQVSGAYEATKPHLRYYRDWARRLIEETGSKLVWKPREANRAGWYWEGVLKERARQRRAGAA